VYPCRRPSQLVRALSAFAGACALLNAACVARGAQTRAGEVGTTAGFDYQPVDAGAQSYGGAPVLAAAPSQMRPLVDAAEQAAVGVGHGGLQWDARLAGVAADLALSLTSDGTPSPDLLDFLVSHHGLTEPSPYLVVAEMENMPLDEFLTNLGTQVSGVLREAPRANRMGAGLAKLSNGRTRGVLALQESYVALQPLPRSMAVGQSLDLRGRLAAPFDKPEAFVTRPDGVASAIRLDVRQADLVGRVSCDAGAGRYQIEVIGEEQHGPTVLANFPIFCGTSPPTRVRVPPPRAPIATVEEAERAIFDLVNRERRRHGRQPLRNDIRLARIARAHSEDMARSGFVGHVSPTTGSPMDRADRAGVQALLLLENVARAYSPEEAQAGLMGSPGHRRNVLHPDATRVGIGVVLGREVGGRRELWVTEVFARLQ
jgi:uncharacterized protein YkwD